MFRSSLARLAALVLLLAGAPPALAVQCNSACPSRTVTGTLPTFIPGIYQGANAWFDPRYDGQGWSFTELQGAPGQPNTGVGVTYTYETDGRPTWLLLQGSWQRETDQTRLRDGAPIAVLTGPVFDGLGGACPTCPFTPPAIAQRRYQQAEVIFHRPDVATVKLDGQVALGGEGGLVPAELVLTRPLDAVLAGQWRYTRRSQSVGSTTYNERSFAEHGCALSITRVDSPTSEHRFDPDPVNPPLWLPPSGAEVQWFRVGLTTCLAEQTGSNANFHIALVPGSRAAIRAIGLQGLTPTFEAGGVRVARYTVPNTSSFMEFYVQGPDTLIARRFGNVAGNPNSVAEFLFTRAP